MNVIEVNGKQYMKNEDGELMVAHGEGWRKVAKTATKVIAEVTAAYVARDAQEMAALPVAKPVTKTVRVNAAQRLLSMIGGTAAQMVTRSISKQLG